ncbi:hypothetical protein D9M68_968540 [compost metagenome]
MAVLHSAQGNRNHLARVGEAESVLRSQRQGEGARIAVGVVGIQPAETGVVFAVGKVFAV